MKKFILLAAVIFTLAAGTLNAAYPVYSIRDSDGHELQINADGSINATVGSAWDMNGYDLVDGGQGFFSSVIASNTLLIGGKLIYTGIGQQLNMTASSMCVITKTVMYVAGATADITSTAKPFISTDTATYPEGSYVILVGTNTNQVTLQDEATLPASGLKLGNATRTLNEGDILILRLMRTDSEGSNSYDWVEEKYVDRDGNIDTKGSFSGTTIDTGQGAVECYAMNQDVRTSDSPTFNGITINQNIIDSQLISGKWLNFSSSGVITGVLQTGAALYVSGGTYGIGEKLCVNGAALITGACSVLGAFRPAVGTNLTCGIQAAADATTGLKLDTGIINFVVANSAVSTMTASLFDIPNNLNVRQTATMKNAVVTSSMTVSEGVYASTGSFTVLASSTSTGTGTVLGFGTNAPTGSTAPDKWIFITDVVSGVRYCVPGFLANK